MEEGNIEDFEEEVDGERLGPGELLVSRLVGHDDGYENFRIQFRRAKKDGFIK